MPIIGYPPPPEGIINNGSAARGWGTGWPNCQQDKQQRIILANGVVLWLRTEIAELAWILLHECLRRGYNIRKDDTGGYNCRPVTGTTVASNHSWGLAYDINWNTNPMGTTRTDIPRWMVELMWEYRFYWGGWYASPDPMHFEYVGTPTQAQADTIKARLAFPEDPMTHPEVDLIKPQEYALAETWASNVSLRDGVDSPKAGADAGGPHWTVQQIRAMHLKLDSLLTQIGALTVAVAEIENILENPPPANVAILPVAITGELRFEQPSA